MLCGAGLNWPVPEKQAFHVRKKRSLVSCIKYFVVV